MQAIIQILRLLSLAIVLNGCASPYMIDRRHDAADIFTASVGLGAGGKVRAGPLQAGLLGGVDRFGVRAGNVFPDQLSNAERVPPPMDIVAICFGLEFSPTTILSRDRGKRYSAVGEIPFVSLPSAVYGLTNSPAYPRHTPAYYTQLEAVVAAGPSIRLGFNPGELIDFLLGWTGIDIFNDDIESKKRPSNYATEGVHQPADGLSKP